MAYNFNPIYKVGDVIEYGPFGGGSYRRVKVEYREEEIKNGYPGFGGTVINGPEKGASVWGYDDQITRVVHY